MEILRRRLAVKCRFPRLPESGSTVDGKVPGSVIFLLTAPLTSTHIHPLALSVIPPACCGLLRTPSEGLLYCAALPAWISKTGREKKQQQQRQLSAARQHAAQRRKTGTKRFASVMEEKTGGQIVLFFLCKSNWDH